MCAPGLISNTYIDKPFRTSLPICESKMIQRNTQMDCSFVSNPWFEEPQGNLQTYESSTWTSFYILGSSKSVTCACANDLGFLSQPKQRKNNTPPAKLSELFRFQQLKCKFSWSHRLLGSLCHFSQFQSPKIRSFSTWHRWNTEWLLHSEVCSASPNNRHHKAKVNKNWSNCQLPPWDLTKEGRALTLVLPSGLGSPIVAEQKTASQTWNKLPKAPWKVVLCEVNPGQLLKLSNTFVVSRAALPEAPSRACNGSFVVRQQIILKCMNADMIYGWLWLSQSRDNHGYLKIMTLIVYGMVPLFCPMFHPFFVCFHAQEHLFPIWTCRRSSNVTTHETTPTVNTRTPATNVKLMR